MGFPNYQYPGYPAPQTYYPGPVPDQLAQLRQNQMQTPMMQPQPMQTGMAPMNPVPTPQNSGIIWVSGKGEADNWSIAPGSAVALWDQNNPVVYLRQADATGKPSTKIYDLVERTENAPAPTVPQLDPKKYVTWEEFSAEVRDVVEEVLADRLKRPSKGTQKKEEE